MTANVRITPGHLIALASVASSGSLTGASCSLGKTQPAVSAQLKQLSEVVGEPVLIRHRYGVRLARAGETLLPYAQACARALDGAQQAAQRLRGLEQGTLRVLASTSIAVYLLPPVLAEFHTRYPGIELRMDRHNANDAMHALEQGGGDIAIVRGPANPSSTLARNFVIDTLMGDETVLVVPRGHPLARRRQLRPDELGGIEIVGREAGAASRALIERMAARAKVRFEVKFQTVGVEALKEAVLQGFGAGFLSRLAVQREVEAGLLRAIRIAAPELIQTVTIAYPMTGQCSPIVHKFVEIVQRLKRSARGASRDTREHRAIPP
jgi:DNA-binding transcriptional LysR family regulator